METFWASLVTLAGATGLVGTLRRSAGAGRANRLKKNIDRITAVLAEHNDLSDSEKSSLVIARQADDFALAAISAVPAGRVWRSWTVISLMVFALAILASIALLTIFGSSTVDNHNDLVDQIRLYALAGLGVSLAGLAVAIHSQVESSREYVVQEWIAGEDVKVVYGDYRERVRIKPSRSVRKRRKARGDAEIPQR